MHRAAPKDLFCLQNIVHTEMCCGLLSTVQDALRQPAVRDLLPQPSLAPTSADGASEYYENLRRIAGVLSITNACSLRQLAALAAAVVLRNCFDAINKEIHKTGRRCRPPL